MNSEDEDYILELIPFTSITTPGTQKIYCFDLNLPLKDFFAVSPIPSPIPLRTTTTTSPQSTSKTRSLSSSPEYSRRNRIKRSHKFFDEDDKVNSNCAKAGPCKKGCVVCSQLMDSISENEKSLKDLSLDFEGTVIRLDICGISFESITDTFKKKTKYYARQNRQNYEHRFNSVATLLCYVNRVDDPFKNNKNALQHATLWVLHQIGFQSRRKWVYVVVSLYIDSHALGLETYPVVN